MSIEKLIDTAKQQRALKKIKIVNHDIPNDIGGKLHAKREEEQNKIIAKYNVTEIVEKRTETASEYKPK